MRLLRIAAAALALTFAGAAQAKVYQEPQITAKALYPEFEPVMERLNTDRVLLQNPYDPDAVRPIVYIDSSIKGHFTDPNQPQMLLILGYYDPSGKSRSNNCGYAILELGLEGQEEHYQRVRVDGIRNAEADPNLCGTIKRIEDKLGGEHGPDGLHEVVMQRFVLDEQRVLSEEYRLDFSLPKPAMLGKIISKQVETMPDEAMTYAERSGTDTVKTVRKYGLLETSLNPKYCEEQFQRTLRRLLNLPQHQSHEVREKAARVSLSFTSKEQLDALVSDTVVRTHDLLYITTVYNQMPDAEQGTIGGAELWLSVDPHGFEEW